MQLETQNGTKLTDPSSGQIEDALRDLSSLDNSFAILFTGEQTYLQTSGSPVDGFLVEYRDGSEASHFQSSSDTLPFRTVVDMFQRYAIGDSTWRDLIAWEKWHAQTPPRIASSAAPYLVGAGLLVAGLVLFFMFTR